MAENLAFEPDPADLGAGAGFGPGAGAEAVAEAEALLVRAGAPARQRPRPWHVTVPAVLALVLGLWRIDRAGPWMDEGYTYAAIHRPYRELWGMLGGVDAVHGCYYLAMRTLGLFLGTLGDVETTVLTLRGVSVLALAVAAAATAAVGARLAGPGAGGRRVGLAAGVLYASTPLAGGFAQEGRSYATVSAVAALTVLLLCRAVARPERTGRWAALAVAVAGVTVLHMFAAALVPAMAATLLCARVGARVWRPWAAAVATALLLAAPVVDTALGQSGQVAWIRRPTFGTVAHLASAFAGAGWPWAWGVLALAVLGAVPAWPGVRRGRGRGPQSRTRPQSSGPQGAWAAGRAGRGRTGGGGTELGLAVVAVPWLLVPPVLVLGASWFHPMYQPRYVLYSLPALALLCAAGLDRLARSVEHRGSRDLPFRPGRLAGVLVGVTVIALVGLRLPQEAHVRTADFQDIDLRGVAATVAAQERPGDAVLFVSDRMRLAALDYPAVFRRLHDVQLAVSPGRSDTLTGTSLPVDALTERLAPYRRLLVVDMDRTWGGGPAAAALYPELSAEGWHQAAAAYSPGAHVRIFDRNGS